MFLSLAWANTLAYYKICPFSVHQKSVIFKSVFLRGEDVSQRCPLKPKSNIFHQVVEIPEAVF
jgi:hypothetical protein